MNVKKILGKIIQADKDYNLIQENDRIAVGVSGGKDSTLLLYMLTLYQKVAKKMFNKNFEVIGIHIEMGFAGMDFTHLDEYCQKLELNLIHEPSKIYDILKLHMKNDKIQCSLCSKFKKGAVNKKAKELNCNKVAFGHHLDDAVETLFLNMIHGGKIATFDPKMHLSDIDVTFIRPFVYVNEDEVNKVIDDLQIPIVKSTCPNDGYTHRQKVKETLHDLYKEYPQAKMNFKLMLHNQKQLSLWHIENEE